MGYLIVSPNYFALNGVELYYLVQGMWGDMKIPKFLMNKVFNSLILNIMTFISRMYEPKATTLTCILVRVVTLVPILEDPSPIHLILPPFKHK